MNIVETILFQCRQQPPAAAIYVPGQDRGLISYRRLEQSIHNISRRLLSLGLRPGSVVALSINHGVLHVVTLLALARLGITTLSVREGVPPLPFRIDALISDSRLPGSPIDRVALADLSWMEGDGQPIERRHIPPINDNDVFRLVLTSGTTGDSKAVAISRRLLAGRIGWHLTMFGNRFPHCDRFYSDMPLTTVLGFQMLIYSLLRGGTMVLPGDRFEPTLQAIEEYKVQCLISPPGGLELLSRWYDVVPAYQSSLELVFCAGDVLSSTLSNRVRSRICSHLTAVYGSTEMGTTATAPAHTIAGEPGAVGFVTPGAAVQIVDGSGTVLAPGREGLLRIRSDYAVDGYFGNPEESAKTFRNGWFYPGDIGRLGEDDLLVITGREQTTLNIGGDKINPEAIERVLSAFDGVLEVGAFGMPNEFGNHEICAAVVCREALDLPKLKAHCAKHLTPNFVPSRIFAVPRLPRNDMGKVDRRRLPEVVGQGPALII
jgi:acyl-coenzyme A synthetase/AMP-(fatty) acid ligase